MSLLLTSGRGERTDQFADNHDSDPVLACQPQRQREELDATTRQSEGIDGRTLSGHSRRSCADVLMEPSRASATGRAEVLVTQ